ncbi:DNA replication and repair protein RecF [Striga asiatica]|uniref:DNA replication and repair protein RecF n=1 Tax=Striga asiatica TaxID=4170 RepID=A0A5A7QC67_STRAF|nr:DNA replication and repair protein RecF [Striga asiatica]
MEGIDESASNELQKMKQKLENLQTSTTSPGRTFGDAATTGNLSVPDGFSVYPDLPEDHLWLKSVIKHFVKEVGLEVLFHHHTSPHFDNSDRSINQNELSDDSSSSIVIIDLSFEPLVETHPLGLLDDPEGEVSWHEMENLIETHPAAYQEPESPA